MKKVISLSLIIIYLIGCFLIYDNSQEKKVYQSSIDNKIADAINMKVSKEELSDDIFAKLYIPKINLERTIYNLDDTRNNVEENVTLLNGSITDNREIIFLAAHSGTGEKAIFTRLDELELKDDIFLSIDASVYNYQVVDIIEQDKDGSIDVVKTDSKQLILTTCSKTNKTKQLLISAEEKGNR